MSSAAARAGVAAAQEATASLKFGCLQQTAKSIANTPGIPTQGVSALEFFLQTEANGGAMPCLSDKRTRYKAQVSIGFFEAVATTDEITLLRSKTVSKKAKAKVGSMLHDLVVKMFQEKYRDVTGKIPKGLALANGKFPQLAFAAIEARQGGLEKNKLVVSKEEFAKLRVATSAATMEGGGSGSGAGSKRKHTR